MTDRSVRRELVRTEQEVVRQYRARRQEVMIADQTGVEVIVVGDDDEDDEGGNDDSHAAPGPSYAPTNAFTGSPQAFDLRVIERYRDHFIRHR